LGQFLDGKSKVSSLGSAAIGALRPSLTGKLAPGTSGAGNRRNGCADEGIAGIAGADCAPGTLENENSSLTAGKDADSTKGDLVAASKK